MATREAGARVHERDGTAVIELSGLRLRRVLTGGGLFKGFGDS